MMKLFLLTVFVLATVGDVLGTNCVCSLHRNRQLWPCQENKGLWVAELYGTMTDPQCLPKALNVITQSGWQAVVYNNSVAYIQQDYKVRVQTCSEPRSKAHIGFNKNCHPKMLAGTHLNPTPKPTTTTAKPTTTTTKPTTPSTTTPAPTTTTTHAPVTTTRPSATPPRTMFTIPKVTTSTKCDFNKLAVHQSKHTLAKHPRANMCPDGSHSSTEALLFETCHNVNYNFFQWKQELKIIDHCWKIPQGEPIAYYAGGRPALLAIFWECIPTGGFKIAFQRCNMPLQVVPVQNVPAFAPQSFFSVSW